ncbi:MAG: hypothetical protein Kow0010_20900 [Dehalococcoidia bacterium]
MNVVIQALRIAYNGTPVVRDVSLHIESGELVVIVGPNGSGKTTLLRGMSRLVRPEGGRVLIGGEDIRRLSAREVARRLAILPQLPETAGDLTVRELVWRGRYPHQGLLQRASAFDAEAVAWAMAATDTARLAGRQLGSLSSGERQRAWIALALAQQPDVLLLDEPTSFLDIQHQVEIMRLLRRLNSQGMTIIAVLHDLLLAGRYADRVIGIKDGRVAFDGPPAAVLTPAHLEPVFGVPMMVLRDPATGLPVPLPRPGPADDVLAHSAADRRT